MAVEVPGRRLTFRTGKSRLQQRPVAEYQFPRTWYGAVSPPSVPVTPSLSRWRETKGSRESLCSEQGETGSSRRDDDHVRHAPAVRAGDQLAPRPPAAHGPRHRSGGRSRPPTNAESSSSTTPSPIRLKGARCCAGRGSTTPTSNTGARRADKDAANATTDKPAGRPPRSAAEVENERLRTENERLTAELTRTKAALDIAGKVYALWETLSESADSDPRPST